MFVRDVDVGSHENSCSNSGLGHLQKGVPALGQVAREMGLEERPGTFQARCGPFKGRGPQLAQGARGHARLGHVFSRG